MDELQQQIQDLKDKLAAAQSKLTEANSKLEGQFDTRLVAFAKMPGSWLVSLLIVGAIFALGVWVG